MRFGSLHGAIELASFAGPGKPPRTTLSRPKPHPQKLGRPAEQLSDATRQATTAIVALPRSRSGRDGPSPKTRAMQPLRQTADQGLLRRGDRRQLASGLRQADACELPHVTLDA